MKKIVKLFLHNNPLTHLDINIFKSVVIGQIKTGSYVVCCIKPPECECNTPSPWYFSCLRSFPNLALRVIYICASLIINTLNIVLLIITSQKQKTSKTKQQSGSYNTIVGSINIGDLLCGIYLTMIWSADIYYGETFVVKNLQWRKNATCTLAFAINLFFSLFLPLLLSILSFSRLMAAAF